MHLRGPSMIPHDNVFVLCTGRCGSMTLSRAAAQLSNWSAGHESRTHLTGAARLAYPPRHVEVDNRLVWLLGRLERDWGDAAAYVHLTRDPEATAQSFVRRRHQGILKGYREAILARSARRNPGALPIDFARDYVDTATENIRHFLRDKSHVLPMRLESLSEDWPRFCDWIGAEGDLQAAATEIATRHNTSRP